MKHKKYSNLKGPGSKHSKWLLCLAICLVFFSGTLSAQQETSPDPGSNEKGSTAAKDSGNDSGYEVKSSVEIGVRGTIVNGSSNKYRSDLNYGAGVRLFDSSVLITAKESKGKAFDSLLIAGSGWNADPNGYAKFNFEKIGWYTFDSTIRRYSYFNNLTNFALNQHTRNTKRDMGDFDATILPQNEKIRFRIGYSYNNNNGPGFDTYDYDRDEFPIRSLINSGSDDFRFGVDGKLLGFNFSFTEGYRSFNDDTRFFIDSPQLGNNPNPNSSFTSFSRIIPENGKSHYHSFTVHRSIAKILDFTGRIIYSDSTSRFTMVEELTGRDRFGNTVVLERSDSEGDAKRPNTVADIGLTVFATNKFKLSNSFSLNSYRITGSNILLEVLRRNNPAGNPLPNVTTNGRVYRFTNFRRFINTFQGDYDVNRFFSFYVGYRYTNRRVILEGLDRNLITQVPSSFIENAENTTNSLIAGFKASPIPKKWTIFFNAEHGEADNAFTRLANYNMTNIRLRNRIRPVDNFSIDLTFQAKDNTNPAQSDTMPPTDFRAEIDSRMFGASFNWMPDPRATFSGGYSYNYLKSEIPVIFPVSGTGSGQGFSRYNLRSNFFHFDTWVQADKAVSFFASYRISKDSGQGDFFSATNYLIEGSYPVSFQSPEARMTVRINNRFDWNVGYQYYSFDEKIPNNQNYRAHLPYTSLRIYFGRADR